MIDQHRTAFVWPFPCEDQVELVTDEYDLPTMLVVDSVVYRLVPAARHLWVTRDNITMLTDHHTLNGDASASLRLRIRILERVVARERERGSKRRAERLERAIRSDSDSLSQLGDRHKG